jgi:predicted DNA-binding transcriptional regulator YafY
MVVGVNRTDRLYALVEELRAVAPRPRSTRWLAGRFEVSARTIERDISALQQSGVPVWAEAGRSGGYCLDKERTLPPVNFTPGEAMALAVGLRQVAGTPFGQDAAAAMRKVLAAMRTDDAEAARDLAARVYLVGDADPPPLPAASTRWHVSATSATSTPNTAYPGASPVSASPPACSPGPSPAVNCW